MKLMNIDIYFQLTINKNHTFVGLLKETPENNLRKPTNKIHLWLFRSHDFSDLPNYVALRTTALQLSSNVLHFVVLVVSPWTGLILC